MTFYCDVTTGHRKQVTGIMGQIYNYIKHVFSCVSLGDASYLTKDYVTVYELRLRAETFQNPLRSSIKSKSLTNLIRWVLLFSTDDTTRFDLATFLSQ